MGEPRFRNARRDDLEDLVRMLADDDLGTTREDLGPPLPEAYSRAFEAIADDPNNELVVADQDGRPVGCLQLTFLPSLTYRGGTRAQIEGVRVAASLRGSGLGGALIREAIARAEARGCRLVQLTTDRSRADAIRFYEALGFRASHAGMKLHLES